MSWSGDREDLALWDGSSSKKLVNKLRREGRLVALGVLLFFSL